MESKPNQTNGLSAREDDWMEMETAPGDRKQSRFKVAKVDFVSDDQMPKYNGASDEDEEDGETRGTGRAQSPPADGSIGYSTYDTKKSFRHYTREALPRLDHYRNVMSIHGHHARPTLDELHLTGYNDHKAAEKLRKASVGEFLAGKSAVKLGWIQGVLIRCLLNIWGVMLFLRLSWVVGQAGIGLAIMVILMATVVTFLTTLSMSAICTNGEVKGGGTYYMISRSLGPEFGGSIGLIFSVANAVAVAMYVVGFAEPVVALMVDNGTTMVDGGMNDVRIVGSVTVVFLLGIAIIGTEWESKAQFVLLVILVTSMVNFVIGSFIPPNHDQLTHGFVGYDAGTAASNFGPEFRDGHDFFSVFSIFFPAATGILAGANISGDLADPQRSIPKGTFLAILITSCCYILFAIIAGTTVVRDSNGLTDIVANTTSEFIQLMQNCSLTNGKCEFGLQNNYENMELVSAYGPLIYAGIFAATLSSALASLVSAPKVFQALCKDRLFPHIQIFAKGYGKNKEPRRGYVLTFFIALACVAIGELNAIAPIISNFFLAAYCLINFSCFHATFARSPGFRPAFRYYNLWVSLLGAILCFAVMFVINWWTALLTFALILSLYIFIYYRKPDVNWGSSTQAQSYKTALSAVQRLNQIQEHVKNYRPQILVLTGNPSSRPPLVDFSYNITKKLSLMICGHYVKGIQHHHVREARTRNAHNWLAKRRIKSFYCLVEDESISKGVRAMLQTTGIGKLRPNVLFMGFKTDWKESEPQDIVEYFNIIHDAFDMHLSFGILRLKEGCDYTRYVDIEEIVTSDRGHETMSKNLSGTQLSHTGSSRESSPPSTPSAERAHLNPDDSQMAPGMKSTQVIKGLSKDIPKDILSTVNQFQRKQKKGTIDVWWLYDDGGLTMLIPYLLTSRSQWSNCQIRVFALANKKDDLDKDRRNMAALLSKFRIDYSDVIVIADIIKPPQESTKEEFDRLIEKFRVTDEQEELDQITISDAEMLALRDKTNRHLRLRELLLEHSKEATLIAMTLPMPRKGTCSSTMYIAWLDILTTGMPPFLLLRGNQTSVLTFYS